MDLDHALVRVPRASRGCCTLASYSDVTASRWLLLVVVLLIALFTGVMIGTLPLSAGQVYHGFVGDAQPMTVAIVRTLRLPRVLLAALVGAGLSSAGAA